MDLNYKYDGTDDHMDSRNIEEDIQEIEDTYELGYEKFQGPADFADHIRQIAGEPQIAALYEDLHSFRDDAASANEGWEYGIQFVRRDAVDDEWMKERAVDLGYIDMGGMHEGVSYRERIDGVLSRWPYSHIDWDAATEEYLSNTVEFTFRGVDYFED